MKVEITAATADTIEALATLLGEYQEFYQAVPNPEHNLTFLKRFLDRDDGIFFIGRTGTEYIGYVSLYFSYSSVTARRVAILNDLYVRQNFRGQGIGKHLIDFAINYSKELAISQVRWCTRIGNGQAQELYAKYDAVKTDWYHYDLEVR